MKVVINTCFGGYSLSKKAIELYIEKSGLELFCHKNSYYTIPYNQYKLLLDEEQRLYREKSSDYKGYPSNKYAWNSGSIERHNAVLVKVIEELKEQANGKYAKLKVVEIPDDIEYQIQDYDGSEHISEVHRTWA
jgi:hypothetical protein